MIHVLRARDEAATLLGAAEAGEALGHVPLGGGVEEGEFVAGLQSFRAREEAHAGWPEVEDLLMYNVEYQLHLTKSHDRISEIVTSS